MIPSCKSVGTINEQKSDILSCAEAVSHDQSNFVTKTVFLTFREGV